MADVRTARRAIFVLDAGRAVRHAWVSDDWISPVPRKDIEAAVAAADERGAELVRSDPPEIDSPLSVRVGGIDSVLQWADAVLTVSGTVTLHVTRHRKPMAIVYRVSPWAWYTIGWWLISTRTFTLPNLIANEGVRPENPDHIVREFVPWLDGDTEPIAEELVSLIEDERKRTTQIEALRSVREQFRHHNAGREGAEAIRSVLGTRTASLSTS
jgi:lipid A disaccharide synthetase